MSMKAILSLLCGALLAFSAAAQVIYKSTMPDGKVVIGDKPAPGATKVEKSQPDTSKQGFVPPSKGEADALKKLEAARLKREAEQGKIDTAEKRLREAEAAKAAGAEPKENERQGTKGGNQRFTDAYWERQKKLDKDVEDARKGLEQTRTSK
jgi:Domain of unknown function (DUF4124)